MLTLAKPSFERLGEASRILEDDERSAISIYNLGLGVNVLPGEAFFGVKTMHSTRTSIWLAAWGQLSLRG